MGPDDDGAAGGQRGQTSSKRHGSGGPGRGVVRAVPRRTGQARINPVGGEPTRSLGVLHTVERTIRISSRVQGMPGYVLDYVILHELGHLLVAGHGPDFWAVLSSYPRLERARGYLDGVAAASGLALSDD